MHQFNRRLDRFKLFDQMDSPALNLTFVMELPDFRPWCKEQGLPPFHVMLCAVLRSVLKVEPFRYRVLDGEVFRIERLNPSFTVKNQNDDLNFAHFEWSDDVREFCARGVAARELSSKMEALNPTYLQMSPRETREQVYVTCIPWLNFTSIQHPTALMAQPDIPSFAWGKFRDAGEGRLELPFSAQVHHGFIDGYHIHLFAEQVAAELAAIISPSARG